MSVRVFHSCTLLSSVEFHNAARNPFSQTHFGASYTSSSNCDFTIACLQHHLRMQAASLQLQMLIAPFPEAGQ
eukprot:4375665-Amphidinium_carterae.1